MKCDSENVKILRFHFAKRNGVPPLESMVLSCVDITYCIEGRMTYYLDGERIELSPSDAIVMQAGSERFRLVDEGLNYYASFNILLPRNFSPRLKGVIRHAVDADTLYILKQMWECHNTVTPQSEEKCLALLSYLYSKLAEGAIGGGNPYVMKVKQIVMDNPSARFSLKELADAVHLAPEYLCTLFKRHTGSTIVQYINSRRIDYAKRLILTRNLSLSDVAERCGFSDYYAFSHAFKKAEGISASQYKKIHRTKGDESLRMQRNQGYF